MLVSYANDKITVTQVQLAYSYNKPFRHLWHKNYLLQNSIQIS